MADNNSMEKTKKKLENVPAIVIVMPIVIAVIFGGLLLYKYLWVPGYLKTPTYDPIMVIGPADEIEDIYLEDGRVMNMPEGSGSGVAIARFYETVEEVEGGSNVSVYFHEYLTPEEVTELDPITGETSPDGFSIEVKDITEYERSETPVYGYYLVNGRTELIFVKVRESGGEGYQEGVKFLGWVPV